MPTNESLRDTLAYFKQQREKKLQEAKAFEITIQQLERELGEVTNGAEITVNVGDSLPPMMERVDVATNGRKPEIRPDEFFGMTQAEAARKYLKRIGHAVSVDELVTALQTGGCRLGGENPKKILYISLIRNTRDFVPPQQGYIGLRDFYPSAGRPAKEKSGKAPKKKGAKTKARSAVKAKRKAARNELAKSKTPEARVGAIPPNKPSELSVAVRSALADKQPRAVDEIASAVSSKLGHPVKKIGIFGVLKKRELFEQVDGKYKLR